MINLFNPSVGDTEIEAVGNVIKSCWLGKGSAESNFKAEFSDHLKVDISTITLTTSCTEALFAIFRILNLPKGSEVIVPSISFPAVASAVMEANAKLVLCDVDEATANISFASLIANVTKNTRAVVVTHYGGVACEMDKIISYCRQNNIYIIEDAACAVTGTFKGVACGTLGDFGVWSFDAMKLITTGDGGAIYVKDPLLKKSMDEYLYLGLPQKAKSGLDSAGGASKAGWWEYDVRIPGRRAIMNDISASIGCEQLKKLDQIVKKREAVINAYDDVIVEVPELKRLYSPPINSISSPYFYTIKLAKRDELAVYLKENNVYTTFRYWPLHKIDLFAKESESKNCFKVSDHLSETCLNLPLHANLSASEVQYVCDLLRAFR